MTTKIILKAALICGVHATIRGQGMSPDLQQKLATIKESIALNQASLHRYTWTQHTEISLNGEVKKTKDDICRYGPDGQVQKTVIGQSPQQQMRGVKGRVAEKKKEELGDYMESAVTLIHSYVPPSPQNLENAARAGNVSLEQSGPGMIHLQFGSYIKAGDSLSLTFIAAAKILRSLNVNSYLSEPKDAVRLEVDFQTLPDGTNYPATEILSAPAKKIQVRVQNSNYQRIGG